MISLAGKVALITGKFFFYLFFIIRLIFEILKAHRQESDKQLQNYFQNLAHL